MILAETNVVSQAQAKMDAVLAFIMHHVTDSDKWTIFPNVDIPLFNLLSVHGLMVLFCATLLILVFGLLYRRDDAVPTGLTNLLETFVAFIRDEISVPYLGGDDGRRMTPLFCSFFFFILTMNLVGLVPCFYAATSNLSVTGALAVISMLFMVVGAIYKTGLIAFLNGFIPRGIPVFLAVLMFPIEFIGMFIRVFALMIRLFANMLAGHIAIFAMLGLIVIYGWVALPAVLLALGVYLLEVFICFLQAYIFTLLSAIFIGQRYYPSH
jgi:F-type H+-transporting ATPase subunit a